jgi:hypothetical protein
MKTFPIALLVVAFLVTACYTPAKRIPTIPFLTDTPIPPSPTPLSQPPDGTYKTTITKEELLSTGLPDFDACENAGTFTLSVTADHWNINQTPAQGCKVMNPTFGGSWKFTGDQVTFHDDEPFGCEGDYTYKWRFNEGELRFTSVDDSACVQRVYYMSEHPWIKEK